MAVPNMKSFTELLSTPGRGRLCTQKASGVCASFCFPGATLHFKIQFKNTLRVLISQALEPV